MCYIYYCWMARYDDCALAVCRFIYIGYELSRLHLMGTSHLYGWYVLNGFPSGMSAKLYGAWTGKVSLLLACLRKIILLIPLIFILPCFLADKVFAVFLAEQSAIFWQQL